MSLRQDTAYVQGEEKEPAPPNVLHSYVEEEASSTSVLCNNLLRKTNKGYPFHKMFREFFKRLYKFTIQIFKLDFAKK